MLRTSYLWPAFAIAAVLFYFAPLFLSNTSIHWDLADVTYPAQKFVEQSVREGKLPHWTPFLYSGTPFLSDSKVGAWYPLHWPFFLIGITPRALAWELALHSFLALYGTFLLARKLLGSPSAALSASLFYAWGGYFAGRSSELAKFESAALLPWLLWAALVAVESGSARFLALAGLAGGLIALAGDWPSLVFSAITLILFVAALRGGWKRSIAVLMFTLVCAGLIGAIVVVPGFHVMQESAPPKLPEAGLTFKGLAALFSADYWGVISGLYKGPDEMRQFYLYTGLLLAPMALAGLVRRQKLWVIAGLTLPALWFAWGPTPGLYPSISRIPGLIGRASPMDFWFVGALGLALLAASGSVFVTEQMKRPHLWIFLVGLTAADLWHWNMYKNPLVYARASYEDIYGKAADRFEQNLAKVAKPPFFRLWSTLETPGFGPLNEPLLSRTEVSYGAGLSPLSRYSKYLEAVESNPKLLSDLAITHGIDTQRGTLVENPAPLPRVTAPLEVLFAENQTTAHLALKTLDPSRSAVVEAPARTISPQGADLRITNYDGASYVIQTDASAEFLLKLAVPYYRGWHATIDGSAVPLLVVDEALQGAFVPSGRHQVRFWFEPQGFRLALVLSLSGLLSCVVLVIFSSGFAGLFR